MKTILKTSLSLSDEVIVAGRISSSQDGIVVMGGHFPMPYGRTQKLPENCGRYRELSPRMCVVVALLVPLTRATRMLQSKIIQP